MATIDYRDPSLLATTIANGLMSLEDKTKLDDIVLDGYATTTSLQAEINRAQGAEAQLRVSVDGYTSKTYVDGYAASIKSLISAETNRAIAEENSIKQTLDGYGYFSLDGYASETYVDGYAASIKSLISAETSRATVEENRIKQTIDGYTLRYNGAAFNEITVTNGLGMSVLLGVATISGAAVVYANVAEFRAVPSMADGTYFKIVSPPGEYRYSDTSGAGWADDGYTILKLNSVNIAANGRAYSTNTSEHAATFAAARAMIGISGRAKHVHIESHTSFGDGGGGIFDVKPVGSYVDNNGTIIVIGSFALVKRRVSDAMVDVREFGAVCDFDWATQTGTDDSVAFHRALEYANQLTAGDISSGSSGDISFGTNGRTAVALIISGPMRKTVTTTLRYRGVQIVGTHQGTETDIYGGGACIVEDHTGHGFVLDTGNIAVPAEHFAPSLSLIGCPVIRATSQRATCLDGISIRGTNWFKGLQIKGGGLIGHRSGIGLDASYNVGYASGLFLTDRAYFTQNREHGFNLPIYWDLSEIRSISCFQNTLGPSIVKIRGGNYSNVDIEGGGAGCEIWPWHSVVEGIYVEQTPPVAPATPQETVPAITIGGALYSTMNSVMNGGTGRTFNFMIEASTDSRILDKLPVRVRRSNNLEIPAGIYPPQLAAQPICSITHQLSQSPYLPRIANVPDMVSPTLCSNSGYTDQINVDGINLPCIECGTVSLPLARVTLTVQIPLVAGTIYVLAYTTTYTGTVPSNAADSLLIYNATGGLIQEVQGHMLSQVTTGETRQKIVAFCAPANSTSCLFYYYPYGTLITDTGYGAMISEMYLAQVPTLHNFPLCHVPTLLQGDISNKSLIVKASTFADARSSLLNKLTRVNTVEIESHTLFGDGGGGIFDVKPVGSYVDNNGTVIVIGSFALIRRGWTADSINVRWFGAQGDNSTDGYSAIMAAISLASTTTKSVFFPYGIYRVSSPIVLPRLATNGGVELIGACPSDDYQALPGTWSSVIRASATMDAVITNRSGSDIGYYNSIRNLVIDGNNLANYGYVNGRQDKGSYCSIVQCVTAGLRLYAETNASVFDNCSFTLNGTGMISDGDIPSGAVFRSCKFRENTLDGILLTSGVQLVFDACITESNGRYGVWLNATNYPLQIIDFLSLHAENNDGYQIMLSTSGTAVPNEIIFTHPLLVSPNGGWSVRVSAGQLYLKQPAIIADGYFGTNYFFVDSTATLVDITSTDANLADLTITGTGSSLVTKNYIKVSGAATGRGFDRTTKANVLKTQINVPTSRAVTPVEVCGTVITNLGQGAANCIVELPEATENFSFVAIIGTAQAANYWRVSALGGASKISLNGGALQGSVTTAVPVVGTSVRFDAFVGAGYYWIATVQSGTWV